VLAPSRLSEDWAAGAVLSLLESHAGCTEQLLALQAIAPQAPRPARPKRG
jgi:hypothetical protein